MAFQYIDTMREDLDFVLNDEELRVLMELNRDTTSTLNAGEYFSDTETTPIPSTGLQFYGIVQGISSKDFRLIEAGIANMGDMRVVVPNSELTRRGITIKEDDEIRVIDSKLPQFADTVFRVVNLNQDMSQSQLFFDFVMRKRDND